MTDELRIHWALHELDEQSARHEAELAKLPEQRRVADARVGAARTKLATLDARAADHVKRRRELEREAESLLQQERKFELQKNAVTNQQQFEAIGHEIANVHAKRSDLETQVLERMDAEERAAVERPELAHALAKAEAEAADVATRLDAAEREHRDALAALEASRAGTLAGLPASLQTRYQRLRGSRSGRAVAAIEKNACGACFRGLSPHALQEAKRREALLVCDGCGRLMLLPPEGAA